MNAHLAELASELLAMPEESRTFLADKLNESLTGFASPETEQAWLEEADRRSQDIESGKVKPVSHDEVMRAVRAAIARDAN